MLRFWYIFVYFSWDSYGVVVSDAGVIFYVMVGDTLHYYKKTWCSYRLIPFLVELQWRKL